MADPIELSHHERVDLRKLQLRDVLLAEGWPDVVLSDGLVVRECRRSDLVAHHVLEPPIEQLVDRDLAAGW
jgi:hypothetical protein